MYKKILSALAFIFFICNFSIDAKTFKRGKKQQYKIIGIIKSRNSEGNNYFKLILNTTSSKEVLVWCSKEKTKVYKLTDQVDWFQLNPGRKIGVIGQWIKRKNKKLFLASKIDLIENNQIGVVTVSQDPKVGYKKFLVIHRNQIGFGPFGAELDGKYYTEGTVFEIISEQTCVGLIKCITINQEGKEATYPLAPFTGSYGSTGAIATVKWDYANNRPTGLDLESEVPKKYLHFVLLLLVRYFFVISVLFILASISTFFIFEEKDRGKAKFITTMFLLFLTLGGCQGIEYKKYLSKFDKIYKEQVSQELTLRAPMGFQQKVALEIELPSSYTFGNVFFVPTFIVFHVTLAYFLYFVLFFSYGYLYYLFIPHPAEKYIKAVKAGKMLSGVALLEIDKTMYNLEKEGIPGVLQSKAWTKRINALTERIKAEDKFMQEAIKLIKIRSRFS